MGDDRSQRVDVRVLAATNRDLRQRVLAGEFRADLFHRLSVFPLHVPPLRERGEDIALLAGFFCEQSRVKMGLKQVGLSESTRMLLAQYGWPGNIRELEHAIYRAIVLARAGAQQGEIILQPQHFQLAGQLDVVVHEPETPPVETPFVSLARSDRCVSARPGYGSACP